MTFMNKLKTEKKMNILNKNIFVFLLSLMFALSFISCDQGGGITVPSGATQLTVNARNNDSLSDNPAVILITEAKALITNVEFEKQSDGRNQLLIPGPFVMSFALDGTSRSMGTQYIVSDFYTKIKFQLHKPDVNENPPDPEFKEGTSDSLRYSFIIKGTYNGAAFVYKSKPAADVGISFTTPVDIILKSETVTVEFSKLDWFKNGSIQLNPTDSQNDSMIDNNIRNSFSRVY